MPLRQKIMQDVPMDVCQSEISPLKSERQSLVIQPQLIQDRRLQIVDVLRLLDGR